MAARMTSGNFFRCGCPDAIPSRRACAQSLSTATDARLIQGSWRRAPLARYATPQVQAVCARCQPHPGAISCADRRRQRRRAALI